MDKNLEVLLINKNVLDKRSKDRNQTLTLYLAQSLKD